MQNRRRMFVPLAVAALAIAVPTAPKAVTMMIAYVQLQAASPGVAETGHFNITGTAKSGSVETGTFRLGTSATAGSVLTADPSGVGTWQAPYFPVPFVATSSSTTATIYGTDTAATGTGVAGNATSATGTNFGGWFGTSSSSGIGVQGYASAATGITRGGNFVVSSPTGYGAYAQNLSNTGRTYSLYAIQTAPAGAAVFGTANAASGDAVGGLFQSQTPTGSGVTGNGFGASSYGGYFKSSGTSGRGAYGLASATTGYAYGGRFDSASTTGVGVYGYASAATGYTYGGYFYNPSTSGRGVGVLTAATTGAAIGVNVEARGTSSIAVNGLVSSLTGFTKGGWFESKSNQGIGVYGKCSGGSGGITFGVAGEVLDANGYGVYSYGKTGASGTKSFRIDHPLDPENKYLMHYCAEGPLPQNVYNGQTVTDANGYAWIDLPDYCESITKDFLYQLTVMDSSDDFVMAKVTKPVSHNRFQIRTSKGAVRVCWEVKGTRNDLWMQKYGAPVEQDKPDNEKGKYQHPELYGLPKERSTRYMPERAVSGPPTP